MSIIQTVSSIKPPKTYCASQMHPLICGYINHFLNEILTHLWTAWKMTDWYFIQTEKKKKKKKRFPVSSDFNYSDFNLLLISSTQHSWHSNERKIQTRDQKIQPSIFWAKLPGIQDPWSLNSLLIHWVVCRKSSQILFSHHEAQREPPVPPLCAPHEVCSTSRLVTVSY